MAQTSGFFDALKNADGAWDRTYKSADYCNNLAAIISNGVVRSQNDDLRVTASGLIVTVGVGRGWINGHWYYNDYDYTFDAVQAPTGNPRYDRVVLRYNNELSGRKISIEYINGVASATPAKPEITRTTNIYDLVLADLYVTPSAQITVEDQRGNKDICGWVYSTAGDNSFFESIDNNFNVWYEEKKNTLATTTVEIQYKQFTVLTAESETVTISIPQYDAAINQKLTVYANGAIMDNPEDYTVSGKVITFNAPLIAGTEIAVYITVAKDGTGIDSIVDNVTNLQNRVEAIEGAGSISDYTYICTGNNDNVAISNIVQTFLAGGTDNKQMRLNIYGAVGITAAASGDGSQLNPYKYFNVGRADGQTRKIILNFANAERIIINSSGQYMIVFAGNDIFIENANVNVASGNYVNIFDGERINASGCEFYGTATYDIVGLKCSGTFRDCKVSILSTLGNAFCVYGNGGLSRVFGGDFYAWSRTDKESVCLYVEALQTENVLIATGVNCPAYARSGYTQTNAIKINNGYATLTGCTVFKAPAVYDSAGKVVQSGVFVISKA